MNKIKESRYEDAYHRWTGLFFGNIFGPKKVPKVLTFLSIKKSESKKFPHFSLLWCTYRSVFQKSSHKKMETFSFLLHIPLGPYSHISFFPDFPAPDV